ncbi:MAG: 3-keto-5-aminohexanoate cleavage protein [Dehalococcoidia bacterium]|nr:3-keto-5-aminohexanoate cleavage protein [Dehalococcoidia bacterium]
MASDKLIICVAPTSNFQGKEANPALPYSPEEVAQNAYDCWNEGASIIHIHGRDKDGLPTNDPSFFRKVDKLIREKGCEIIIQHSTAPANPIVRGLDTWDIDDGLRTIQVTPPPEMASLDIAPGSIEFKGKGLHINWDRPWAVKAAKMFLDKGIKAEVEIYNNSQMDDLYYLIDKGVLTKPYWVSFVMDMHRVNQSAVHYSPKTLMHHIDLLPPDSMFSVLGIAAAELQATTLSMLLGGHCRVGFEDNFTYAKGVPAKSNAQLVARSARIGRELGREPATPAEARAILGIPPLKIK